MVGRGRRNVRPKVNTEFGAMVRFAGEEEADRPKTAKEVTLPPRPRTAKEERDALVTRLQVSCTIRRTIRFSAEHFDRGAET